MELENKVRVEVDPQTGDGLAFEIEDFRRGFLAKRPCLAPLREQVQATPIALRRMESTPFISAFLHEMERLIYQRVPQLDPADLKVAH